MKLLGTLLALSLAANGYLAFREYRSISREIQPEKSSPPTPLKVANTLPSTSPAALWDRISRGDAGAMAALRKMGWPEETLQLLATVLVNERFQGPERSVSLEYWKERESSAGFFPGQRKNASALEKERDAILKSLLGPNHLPAAAAEPFLQGIPREKVAAVATIKTDYAAILGELSSFSEEQMLQVTREERADIARVLSPDEFFEYELRNSITASELRYNTAAFEPTEAEFRALFRIKNPLDEPAFSLDALAARKLRKDTERELDAQARTVLGEERFQQFVLSRDAEYRRFYHLSKHLELPTATARAAYEIKADIDRRSRALDADPATPPAERLALAEEAERRLTAAFGQRGIELYKYNSQYLQLLRRPSAERPSARDVR